MMWSLYQAHTKFLKTLLLRLLHHPSPALAFSSRVGFLLKIAVCFLPISWIVQRVRAIHRSVLQPGGLVRD